MPEFQEKAIVRAASQLARDIHRLTLRAPLIASAAYPGGLAPAWEALRLGLAFSSLNLGVCLFWTSAGALLSALLSSPPAWKVFLRVMALLLAGSVLLVFR